MRKTTGTIILLIIIASLSNCSESSANRSAIDNNLVLFPLSSAPSNSTFTSLAVFSDSVYAVTGDNSGVDIVVANYNSSGDPQWSNSSAQGPSFAYFSSIAVDATGIYAAGMINRNGTYDFGNSQTAAGNYNGGNALLVQYALNGVAQWARSVSPGPANSTLGPAHSVFSAAAIGSGGVYAAGRIDGSGDFNFGTVTAPLTVSGNYANGDNAVVVKYNSSGTALWAQSVTVGPLDSLFTSVAVDGSNNIYTAGAISGKQQYDFGITVTGYYVNANAVLVKYNSSGVTQWAQSIATPNPDPGAGYIPGPAASYFNSVTVGSDGNVYAAGYIYGTEKFNFGNSQQVSGTYAGYKAVLVKYDIAGNAQWIRTVPAGPAYSSFSAVAAGPGVIYAAGIITGTGTYDFGSSQTVAGNYTGGNCVLVKYDLSGNTLWARSIVTGPGSSSFTSVATGTDGIYTSGLIYGTGTYDFGNSLTVTGSTNYYNPLLVKYNITNGNPIWAK